MAKTTPGGRTIQALRVGAAATIVLAVVETWWLPHANLAVYTTHVVMTTHPNTAFQKGVERIVGRGAGILVGVLISSFVGESKVLVIALEVAGLVGFFYAHFCGRMAYTYLSAGLYLNAIVQYNEVGPEVAWVNGGWMFLAIVIGVTGALLVGWLTGAEKDLRIDPGAGRLFPIQAEPLGRAAQVTATVLLAQYIFWAIDIPPDANTFALFAISITPDYRRMTKTGGVVLAGMLLSTVIAIASLLVLNRIPRFPMLATIVFVVTFGASYAGQGKGAIGTYGYLVGLLTSMFIVRPLQDVETVAETGYNILAMYVYAVIAFVIGRLWVGLGIVPPELTPPHPARTESIRAEGGGLVMPGIAAGQK